MNTEEAFHLLGLAPGADGARIRAAYDTRRAELTERLATAPTEGLRAKYEAALGELVRAYELAASPGAPKASGALSQTQLHDLPGATPSFTQHGIEGLRAQELSAGMVLIDRYEIRRLLGRGGMGAVYEVFDRLKQEVIAIKVLLPSLLGNQKAKERFLNEAKLACRLSHPHIVKVFDVGISGTHTFMTMELLEGQTLRALMQASRDSWRNFPVEWVIGCARQLIAALGHAHQSIIHRDLKPENVWVDAQGHMKLMDFGIARAFTNTDFTKTGVALGTAYYMAPEQLVGSKDVDARADQYSLGVILYELLTNQVPQGAVQTPRQVRREVPAALSAAIMKAMAPKAADRFPTLDDLAAALEGSQSLKNSPVVKWGAIAAASVLVVITLFATGVVNSAWQTLRPVSNEEQQDQQLEAIRLQAQIDEGLKAVNDGYRRLQDRARAAQNSRSGDPAAAQALQDTLRKADVEIVQSAKLRHVRTEFSVAQQLIRDRDYARAITVLRPLVTTLDQQRNLLAVLDGSVEAIAIDIDFDGTYVLNGYAKSLEELEAELLRQAGTGPLPMLRIRPDKRSRAQHLTDLLSAAERSGFAALTIEGDSLVTVESSAIPKTSARGLLIEINAEGAYVMNSEVMTLEALEAELLRQAGTEPVPMLRIRPNKLVRAEPIIDLLSMAQRAGFAAPRIERDSTAIALPQTPPGRSATQVTRSTAKTKPTSKSSNSCPSDISHLIPTLSPVIAKNPEMVSALRNPIDPFVPDRRTLEKVTVSVRLQIDAFKATIPESEACVRRLDASGSLSDSGVDYSREPQGVREACLHALKLTQEAIRLNEEMLRALECRRGDQARPRPSTIPDADEVYARCRGATEPVACIEDAFKAEPA